MKMEKPAMCRICLVQNVRMYVVVNKSLQELYKTLTDVPFITEDCRPMLACFFCCTKMKQCEEFQRKCLEAEDLFSKMLNEDCELNSSINHGQVEFYGGFIKTPMVHISIDDTCQMEYNVIKKELPAFDDVQDDIVEPAEELLSDERLHSSYPNVDDLLDSAPHHSKSDSENDVPLIKFKTGLKEEQNRGVNVAVPILQEDTTTDEQQRNEPSDSKMIRNTFSITSKSVTTSDKTFKCDQLSQKRLTNFKRQKNTHVADKPYECHICQRCFSRKDNLTTHIRIHTEKPYKCDICHRCFSQKDSLAKHILNHTGEKPHKCDICQRGFRQKVHLTEHFRIHIGEKPHKCDMCQRCFSRKGSLAKHIRLHAGERPYKCDLCQHRFSEKGNLTKHIRIHTGQKSYKCDICHRCFSRKDSLAKHILIHTGQKSYKCDICQRGFRRKVHLTEHFRIHTGEKPYKCDICQHRFSQKVSLAKHIRLHTGEKPYKCDICQHRFSQKCHFSRHIRLHAGERPYKCDICQHRFSEKGNLASHIRIHTGEKPYKCNICQHRFSEKGNLTKHIRIHTS